MVHGKCSLVNTKIPYLLYLFIIDILGRLYVADILFCAEEHPSLDFIYLFKRVHWRGRDRDMEILHPLTISRVLTAPDCYQKGGLGTEQLGLAPNHWQQFNCTTTPTAGTNYTNVE